MSRRKKRIPREPVEAEIVSLSHDGKGVAKVEGKVVFVEGALPGELVRFQYSDQHRKHDEAFTLEVLKASPDRVEPPCEHYSICGACSLQHMAPEVQIAYKQDILLENLKRIGKVEPEEVLPALCGDSWGYRRRARLGVKHVFKKEKVLVGFREKRSSFLAELTHCDVLCPEVGNELISLAELIASLSIHNRVAQIEVSKGDNGTALVFRNLDPFSDEDIEKLKAYGEEHNFQMYGQPKGPATIHLIYPEQAELYFELKGFGLTLHFLPSDFIQVNGTLNDKMLDLALELLEPQKNDSILDLFCGLGNFTLPLATRAGSVVGVEGEASLVQRARDNAQANNIDNVTFYTANLADLQVAQEPWLQQRYDKVLLDPPRSGALEMLEPLSKLAAKRIVYVSCNPATLARDAGELVSKFGYKLIKAGVMDMFPHTAHVESIAVFERA